MSVIEFVSLPAEQQATFMASPMSKAELDRLVALQDQGAVSFKEQLKAELETGQALAELKVHPNLLWQRSNMFRTKSGGWKKRRSWFAYVVKNNLAESGEEADRLIAQWKMHEMFCAIGNPERGDA